MLLLYNKDKAAGCIPFGLGNYPYVSYPSRPKSIAGVMKMLFPQPYNHQPYSVLQSQYADQVGKKVGKWLILSYFTKKYRSHYVVKCECGRVSTPAAYHVMHGLTSACNSCAPKKHGWIGTPTYRSWNAARNRCNNPTNKDYMNYGARGITMCERWNSFKNFLADMGEKPAGLTLDRINNNGNYEPGNCRWATYSVQNSNQRRRKSSMINSRSN
jgi:hypothetical protein